MDQYLSTVIIAVITGIFSIITLLIQRKQDKVINKIDKQAIFIEREKSLKQKMRQKEKEREMIIHEIMILILDTNLRILKNSSSAAQLDNSIFDKSSDLQNKYNAVSKDIDDIVKEYDMVLSMTEEFQAELEKIQNTNNNNE